MLQEAKEDKVKKKKMKAKMNADIRAWRSTCIDFFHPSDPRSTHNCDDLEAEDDY